MNPDERTPHVFIHARDGCHSEVDPTLNQVRPCPRPGDHHGELALAHQVFLRTGRDALWQDTGVDQIDDFRQSLDGYAICDAHVLEVVVCADLPENVATSVSKSGENTIPDTGPKRSLHPKNRYKISVRLKWLKWLRMRMLKE